MGPLVLKQDTLVWIYYLIDGVQLSPLLLSILSLLLNPNPDEPLARPLEPQIASLYRNDMNKFIEVAK